MKPPKFYRSIYELTRRFLIYAFQVIAGIIFALSLLVLIVFSSPVFLFRGLTILLAKYMRPDLGQPLNPLSVGMVGDIYPSSKPPRANVIYRFTFDGRLESTLFENLVLSKWIHAQAEDGKVKYPQFSQFPEAWLGFMFWRKDPQFDIKNHIYCHDDRPRGSPPATEEDANRVFEELLNAPHPPARSPWQFHIIQNYRDPKLNNNNEMSLLFLKFHHSLTDGHGIVHAIANDLMGQVEFQLPKVRTPPAIPGFGERVAHNFRTVVRASIELVRLSRELVKDNPWKIPDEQKAWRQLYAKSELISLQQLKQIRSAFGVTLTTILVSGISAAIHRNLEEKRRNKSIRTCGDDDSNVAIPFLNVMALPTGSRMERLTNHLTGGLFNIPTGNFRDPLERLLECQRVLEKEKGSIIPKLSSSYVDCLGSHFRWLLPIMMKWQSIATGLTNLPVFDENFVGGMLGRKLIAFECAAGAQAGEAGAAFAAIGNFGHIRITVTAEQGLFSRDEAEALANSVEEEILNLYSCCSNPNWKKDA